MMKTKKNNDPIGIRLCTDDAEIRMIMESEGLWAGYAEKCKTQPEASGLLLYGSPKTEELWVMQTFKGVPGDEGMTLTGIPIKMFSHPKVVEFFKHIGEIHGVTIESLLKNLTWLKVSDPSRN